MMQKNNIFVVFAGLVFVLIFWNTGCASTAKFDYTRAPGVRYQSTKEKSLPPITVMPFVDARPVRFLETSFPEQAGQRKLPKELRGIRGTFATGWLPLMPYAWMSTELPEDKATTLATLKNFWCNFERELAEAAVDSLKAAKCFRDVCIENDIAKVETRYVFQGTIHSTKYEGTRITYGVTYLVAPLFWLLGAPDATSKNTLEVTFQILDLQKKQIIWQYRFNGARSTVHGFYYNIGEDTANYPILMKMALNAALHNFEFEVEKARKSGIFQKK